MSGESDEDIGNSGVGLLDFWLFKIDFKEKDRLNSGSKFGLFVCEVFLKRQDSGNMFQGRVNVSYLLYKGLLLLYFIWRNGMLWMNERKR